MMASRYSVRQSASVAGVTRGSGRLRRRVAADLAAGLEQRVEERHEMRRGAGAVDQQRLGGAADAGAPHLGVEHDVARHVEIGAPRRR